MRLMSTRSLPMPMIMRSPCWRRYCCCCDCLRKAAGRRPWRWPRASARSPGQADEHRLANDKMPDIQLAHLRQCGEVRGGLVVEAMAGMNFDARLPRQARRRSRAVRARAESRRHRRPATPRNIAPCETPPQAPGAEGGINLPGLGIDEERHPDAGVQAGAAPSGQAHRGRLPRRARPRW